MYRVSGGVEKTKERLYYCASAISYLYLSKKAVDKAFI